MQRRKDLPSLIFTGNVPTDGRPHLAFIIQTWKKLKIHLSLLLIIPYHPKSPICICLLQNPTPFSKYQSTCVTSLSKFQPPNRSILSKQKYINPPYFPPSPKSTYQPQSFTQNYIIPQNSQSTSVAQPLPQKTTFQSPVTIEDDANGYDLDH